MFNFTLVVDIIYKVFYQSEIKEIVPQANLSASGGSACRGIREN